MASLVTAFEDASNLAVEVRNGQQLAAALRDTRAGTIRLLGDWLQMGEADVPWATPVLITRNVTLRGNGRRPTALDLSYLKHKVGAGV